MSKVVRIDVQTRMFDGFSRVILFKDFDLDNLSSETTLAQILAKGYDCGPIVEGSPSWDGDESSIDVLKDTEGGVLRSKDTPGTFAWSCRIPHSKETAMLAGGVEHTADSLGDGFELAEGKPIIGLNPEDMDMRCPVGILNLARNELGLFPKGAVNFSPGVDDDDLWEYTLKAQGESIKTKNLSTLMFIPLAADPLAQDTENS